MNLRQPALIGFLAASFALVGCGVVVDGGLGETATEKRDIDDVTAVSLATGGGLTITTGEAPALTVTAGEDVIDRLTSEVHDGILVLDVERGHFGNLGRITYELVLPAVDEIRVDGSGDVDAELTPTDELTLTLNGSGDITAREVEVEELTVEVAGSGTVDLAGSAGRQAVSIEGSGDYEGADLESEDAAVSVAGSGDADVHATRTLDAVIEGSGSIVHSGGATVTSHVAGSGDVEER